MNRLFRLRHFAVAQGRFYSGGNKGFIKNLLDNLKKEYESDKHIKESMEQFKKSTQELEQSDEFKKIRDLYKKMESEIPADTGDKILGAYRAMMERVQKETDQLKRADMINKGLENVGKIAENVSLNLKDSEVVKQALRGAEAVAKELRTDRYKMYSAPDSLKTRFEVAGKVGDHKIIEANEDVSGVVLHKDSRWVSAWKDFKDNNPYVLKIFDLKTRIDESDNFAIRSTRFMTDRIGGLFSGLIEKNDTQKVLEEIIKMDPSFTLDSFLRYCQFEVIPNVMEAIVRGDLVILKDWCHEAVYNVLSTPMVQAKTLNYHFDSTVLDISNLDMVTGTMLDQGPVLVIRFDCQMINVIRDTQGKVVEGDPDKCLRVIQTWALCRDQTELNPWAAWRIIDLTMTPQDQWF